MSSSSSTLKENSPTKSTPKSKVDQFANRDSSPLKLLQKKARNFIENEILIKDYKTDDDSSPRKILHAKKQLEFKKFKEIEEKTQTDDPESDTAAQKEDIVAQLTSDEGSLEYWKEVAEDRREALEEVILENEQLHERIAELERENQQLRTGSTDLAQSVLKLVEESELEDSALGSSMLSITSP